VASPMMHSQLFKGPKCEPKWKTTEEGVGARSLTHNTLKGKGVCWSSRMGLGRVDKLHRGLHTTHTKWFVHSWSTLGVRTSHEQHIHYYILCLFAKGQTKNLKVLRKKNKKPEGFAKEKKSTKFAMPSASQLVAHQSSQI
jgi:hypothetical protein